MRQRIRVFSMLSNTLYIERIPTNQPTKNETYKKIRTSFHTHTRTRKNKQIDKDESNNTSIRIKEENKHKATMATTRKLTLVCFFLFIFIFCLVCLPSFVVIVNPCCKVNKYCLDCYQVAQCCQLIYNYNKKKAATYCSVFKISLKKMKIHFNFFKQNYII